MDQVRGVEELPTAVRTRADVANSRHPCSPPRLDRPAALAYCSPSTEHDKIAGMASEETICRPWVDQDQGPYHRDHPPTRIDIVEDRPGVPLSLQIRVVDRDAQPITVAELDVWHCDALGRYSGFPLPGHSASPAPPAIDETFLRGRQVTDNTGRCELRTVYPGWYTGRTVHIHLIATVDGRHLVSQLFLPDDLTDTVHSRDPYASRPDRDTRNPTDDIYANRGDATLLTVTPHGDGYVAAICLIIDSTT